MISEGISITPDLVKYSQLSEGVSGRAYAGMFRNSPVVIKEALDPSWVQNIVKETKFLIENQKDMFVEKPIAQLGIPLQNWKVHAGLISPVIAAHTDEVIDKGVLVMKPADKGRIIMADYRRANQRIPMVFHFATWASWINLLQKLRLEKGVVMDSQVEDFALGVSVIPKDRTLYVTKMDCLPAIATETIPGLNLGSEPATIEEAIVNQIVDEIDSMYGDLPPINEYFGNMVHQFSVMKKKRELRNLDLLGSLLKTHLEKIDWTDEFFTKGDKIRFHSWIGRKLSDKIG